MNKIVKKVLLAGDKFMPEMNLREPGFTYIVLVDHFQKTKKEYKNLKKQEIHNIFIKTNYMKLVFNIWLMENLKI